MANPTNNGYQQVFAESVSAVTATNTVSPGSVRHENGADWIYVYNGSSDEQIDVGRGVKLASGSSAYTVDVALGAPSTVSAAALAGVCQNATIPTGQYGWIMTRGFASALQNKLSAVATGDRIFATTSGVFRPLTASTGLYDFLVPCGWATSDASAATTATATFSAYIKAQVF